MNEIKENLYLVKVDSEYCNFLRQFDSRVPYNHHQKETRPFLGILFKVNGLLYFAPLSSPKPKHLKLKSKLDFLKIANGKLGAVNFNNMIPVTEDNINVIDLDSEGANKKDKQYISLLNEQLYWLNRNSEKICGRAESLYFKYINDTLAKNIKDRCCNYVLLEEKCSEYNAESANILSKT